MKKYLLLILLSIVLLLTGCGLGHIEDVNGEDDYSLATLTDDNIINPTGSTKTSSFYTSMNKMYKVKVKKFSGVEELAEFKESYSVSLTVDFKVNSGNGLVVLVKNDEIVKRFEPNTVTQYNLQPYTEYSLRVAGETCNYELKYYWD